MFSKRKIVKKNIKKSLFDDSRNCGEEVNLFKGPLNEENNKVEKVEKYEKDENEKHEKDENEKHEKDENEKHEKGDKISSNVCAHEEGIKLHNGENLSETNNEIQKNITTAFMTSNKNINDAYNAEGGMKNQQNEKMKKKLSFIERKKKEESDRVNRLNTSFNIYSDSDSDSDSENYIMIKKKKKNIKKKFAGVNNDNIYEKKENVEKINYMKDNAQNDEKHIIKKTELDGHEKLIYNKHYSRNKNEQNNEQYYKKYNTNRHYMYAENSDGNEGHENDVFSVRGTEGDINEMDGDSLYSYTGVNGDRNIQNISQVNNIYKGEIGTNNSLLIQENEKVYDDHVIINFEDEIDDDENDEENKLIKEIKLKKNIIRKKKEISEKYLFEYKEDSNDDCKKIYPYDYSYIDKYTTQKNIYLNEINNNFENEDDFGVDDTYNYETLNEIKYKLLIKKNKNEEIGNLYEQVIIKSKHDEQSELRREFSSNDLESESKGNGDTPKLYKLYGNASGENVGGESVGGESDKIKKIINSNIFKELSNEKKKMELLASSNYDDNINEDIYMRDKSAENIPIKKEKTNNLNNINMDEKYNTYENNKEGKSFIIENKHTINKFSENGLKIKEDIEDITFYNNENENMFENIKRNFEQYGVCNLEIVKMNNDIKKDYDNYKTGIKNYENKKRLEKHNNIEYKKLKKMCKKKKEKIITCIYINKFIEILRNLILEKYKCIDNALQLLYKMESNFSTIYFNMKLYIYKEYYEHNKLKFIDDYIFNSKFYKKKKNKYKTIQLNYLIKEDHFIQNQNNINTLILFYNNFVNNIYNYQHFNKTSYHYIFDGFSSNYSTDSSNLSENDDKTNKELKDNEYNFYNKCEKRKYFQTIKMKDIKNKFLSLIENIFENVNLYFLNFKNVIKYFYLFKYYNSEFFKNNNCLECFQEIFFFFVKLELLYWDPILQFSLKKKKKNIKFDMYDRQIKRDILATDKNGCDKNGCNKNGCDKNGCDKNGCDKNGCDKSGCDKNVDEDIFPHFNYNNLFINSENDNDDNQFGDPSESLSEISVSSSSTDEENVNNDMGKRESKNSSEENNNINFENINKIEPTFKNFQKNHNFEKKKYKLNKKYFNTSPFIKSFEWYKFMDELMLIYDISNEKEILKNLYKNIFNKKIYELIDTVWNPFSLNQSINLVAIIKEYIIYNEDHDLLFLKIRERICIYIKTYLESRKNIMNQKKRNIFLIRCLKLLKCIKNILAILSDKELHQIVQKLFYDVILANCDYSNKFHNLILSSLIPIIQSVNILYNDNFNTDMSKIMNRVISNLESDDTCFTTLHIDH
ncbi:hypothetical protein YYC_05165 [Plasmodium yoelii 17X]|uniref:Uncharacterized protein n=1 Tax=Plasmodium yoelii 17X TaxID=1323249 RepID=V7PB42_PLAYE|nr:hypothetical protein YYC_05165 [Plasmodium yoelii 17X]